MTIKDRLKACKCEYCFETVNREDIGYISSYDAVVCFECYEDNHEI